MVGLEIRIDVVEGKRQEFLQAAETLLKDDSKADRCFNRAIFEEHGAPNRFLWIEEWEEADALERRLASGEFHTLLGALRVLAIRHDIRVARTEPRTEFGRSAERRSE